MSRKKKRNEIESLFKEAFTVSFIHKPNMETPEDTFYYLILDDLVRIRLKLFGTILVIDEVTPLSMKYMTPIFKSLLDLLVGQDKYTVLISILGNTNAIRETCANTVLIEDERFITVPFQYYKRMVDYYKGDKSKYGFYLLAVVDDMDNMPIDDPSDQEDEPPKTVINLDDLELPDEVDMGPPIKLGVKPIIDRFLDLLADTYETPEDDGVHNNAEANVVVKGIHFKIKTNLQESEIRVSNFRYDDEYLHSDVVRLFSRFSDFLDECPNIYIEVNNSEANTVCEFLCFKPQTTNLGPKLLYDTIGVYRVKHM